MRAAPVQPPSRRDAWSEHLDDLFETLGVPPGVMADNVSASVAAYCREFLPRGAQRSDLVLLIARAFCAVNDRAAARRALSSLKPHDRHVARWLEILSELHQFPALLPYFSLGAIRPADWVGARLDRMWTLDFERLALSDAEMHEMMIQRSVRAIVEHMLVFWDATAGEGVLGLKGLAKLELRQDGSGADDVSLFVSDLFRQRAEARGWRASPTVMNLDL